MRLHHLLESSQTIWYHGTPEFNKFNGFENRTYKQLVITDPDKWEELGKKMQAVEHGSPEFHEYLSQRTDLQRHDSVPSPIFFSKNRNIAATYADARRAFDYQEAVPRVIAAHIDDVNPLVVNFHGRNFRGALVKDTINALKRAGHDDKEIHDVFRSIAGLIRGDGDKISTNMLFYIAWKLGHPIVDAVNVRDSYNGGGSPTTVRIVGDPSLIHVISN